MPTFQYIDHIVPYELLPRVLPPLNNNFRLGTISRKTEILDLKIVSLWQLLKTRNQSICVKE